MNLTLEQKQLMIAWAAAFVERGKIDLQTSFATTQLVGEIQASLVPAPLPAAKATVADVLADKAKANSKRPAKAKAV